MPEDDVRADIYGYQRLEAEFSRYRSEFQRTRDDVLAISGEFTNFKSTVQSGMADLRTGISSLGTKLDEKSKTNWPAVALAISMVPAIWLFVTTYTQNAISPTAAGTAINGEALKRQNEALLVLQQSAATNSASGIASLADRTQLNERVRLLESEVGKEAADRRAMAAETRVKIAEIETQFHAISDIENLRSVWQHRINSLMWEKINPGQRYPSDSFFPTSIFRGDGQDSGNGP